MTEEAKKRMDSCADLGAKAFNWSGVINKLRTGYHAYRLGIKTGYVQGMQDPDANIGLVEENKRLCKALEEIAQGSPTLAWAMRTAHLALGWPLPEDLKFREEKELSSGGE